MTTRASFTEAALRRAIRAAEKQGYRVGGVRPDGTMLVYKGDERPADLSIAPATSQSKEVDTWADR